MAFYIALNGDTVIMCGDFETSNPGWIEVPNYIEPGSTYVAGVVTPLQPGYYLDHDTLTVLPVPAPPPVRLLTKLQFRNRFTPAEKVAIYTAASANVSVQIYLDDINAAEYINLDDASTTAGVAALEAAGLIGTGRTAEILA